MSRFNEDIDSVEESPGRFLGRISGNWSVNGIPDGGYLMAIMARAALEKSELRSTPIVTANFVSRSAPGPAQILVEEISRSSQFQRLQVRLLQEGAERVRSLVTLAAHRDDCSEVRYESDPPALAPRERCVPLPLPPAYTLFGGVELLLDPSCAGWLENRLVDRSEMKGWMRLREDRPHDIPSLLMLCDSLPPAILASRGMIAWVPTIELTVNVRHMPTSRWLNCSHRTRFVTCGLVEEDGQVWDEAGNLIAISRQIAQIRAA